MEENIKRVDKLENTVTRISPLEEKMKKVVFISSAEIVTRGSLL